MPCEQWRHACASSVLSHSWDHCPALTWTGSTGSSRAAKVARAHVPVTRSGCGICGIAVWRQGLPSSTNNGEAERPRAVGVKWTDDPGISFPFHQNEAARRGDAAVCNEEEASRPG